MALSWALRRQLKIFILIAVFAFAVVGWVIYGLKPAPSCTDGKLNQNEERVDCGGECEACIGNPENLIVYWTRTFELTSGKYEAAALIENPNFRVGSRSLSYKIKLFENNILVAQKNGETFLNPDEKLLIFESDIDVENKKPNRAEIEFIQIPWKVFTGEKPNILVSSKVFERTVAGNGRVKIVLRNQTLFAIENIFVSVVLLDSGENAIGVSSTKVDMIRSEGSREVFFTWPHPFDPAPAGMDVYLRTDLTK